MSITPESAVFVYAAEEQIPEGWTVSTISDGGSLDAQNGLIKWGPYFDNISRNLSYGLTAPATATGDIDFSGAVSFDGADESIGGDSILSMTGSTGGGDPGNGGNTGGGTPSTAAVRDLPTGYSPGQALNVTLSITPEIAVFVYAVEEQIPEGWAVGTISDGGSLDVQNGLIKWGPFFDNSSRSLTYGLTAPTTATGDIDFSGAVSFDGADESIGGELILSMTGSTGGGVDPGNGGNSGGGIPSTAAVRDLPTGYSPGQALNVTLSLTPESAVFVCAAEEQIPEGWTVGTISDGGSLDVQNGLIKWGPFFDNTSRNLTYGVTAPATATGDIDFSGAVSFDGADESIGGDSILSMTGLNGGGGDPPSTTEPARIVSLNIVTGLGAILVIEGTPDTAVSVELSIDLIQWKEVGSISLNGDGSGSFIDSNADLSAPMAFYRMIAR